MGDHGAAGRLTFFFDRSVGKAVPLALWMVEVSVAIHDEVYRPGQVVFDEDWMRDATAKRQILVTRMIGHSDCVSGPRPSRDVMSNPSGVPSAGRVTLSLIAHVEI